jgi:hypothetical protein
MTQSLEFAGSNGRLPAASGTGSKIKVKVRSLGKFRLGDHLAALRAGYMHHGIFIGCNQVISFSLRGIRQQDLGEFANTHEVRCVPLPANHLPRFEIAARAISAKASPLWSSYNLVTRNCESFANWCITGNATSFQVVKGAMRIIHGELPLDPQALEDYRREKREWRQNSDLLDSRHLVGNLLSLTGNEKIALLGDAIDDIIS